MGNLKHSSWFIFILLIMTFTFIYSSEHGAHLSYEHAEKILLISALVIETGILIFSFVLYTKRKKKEKEFHYDLIEAQQKNVKQNMMVNQQSHQLKHDMKHFISHIRILLENGEQEKAIAYLDGYYSTIQQLNIPAYTPNETLNYLINNYRLQAKINDIDFCYSCNGMDELAISDQRLYILLSNALDNAFIHATTPKKVSLRIEALSTYVRFMLINPTDKKDCNQFEHHLQHNGHGYGTMSMKSILDDAGGHFIMRVQHGYFITTMLIPTQHTPLQEKEIE